MREITIRRLPVKIAELEPDLQWANGDAWVSQTFNAMSMMFPIGEKYFIDSLLEALPDISDDSLREQIRLFVGQEAEHTRIHVHFNRHLESRGLRFVLASFVRWRIEAGRNFDIRNKLAITMAYEHFTAVLGDRLLAWDEWLEGAPPEVRAMWLWHAAEECEHRAVAFDAYLALAGGYFRRVGWMLYISILFVGETLAQTLHNLHRSGALFRWRTVWEAARFLFGARGVLARTWKPWLAYFRPSFHPLQLGDDATARRQIERLFG